MVFRRILLLRNKICIFVALSLLFMTALRRQRYNEESTTATAESMAKLGFLYPTVNTTNFGIYFKNLHYIFTPQNVCRTIPEIPNKNGNRTIISFVHSSRENFHSRQMIRETYGSVKLYREWSISLVFLIGVGSNNENMRIEERLGREIGSYGDILMGNFEDTFPSLTYKHLMGYKWAIESCDGWAKYYVKSDDYTIVNIFHVVENLIAWKGRFDSDFYCHMNKEYTEFGTPTFCGYGMYLTSLETVRRIYSEANLGRAKFSRYDDVYLTGNVRDSVNRHMKNGSKLATINLRQVSVMHFDYNSGFGVKTDIKIFGKGIKTKMWFGIVVQSRNTRVTCSLWLTVLQIHTIKAKPFGICAHVS